MHRIRDQLRDAKYITTIDLCQAYHQIPLPKESREITTFDVPGKGLFHYKVPFGLTNAPATFQRFVDQLFGQELEDNVFKYLDDIIIVSQNFDAHIRFLERVLIRLREAGLVFNRNESEFVRSRVSYLGFILECTGLHIDLKKVAPILELPAPHSVKQTRRLLGMVTWYRRFIPDLATYIKPITRLIRPKQKWQWGPEQETALEAIRRVLTSSPILACPNFQLPFLLQCHANPIGLGAMLSQKENDKEVVIAYASKTLTEGERKYSATERECLALIWAVKKFRPYLESKPFTVYTDAHSLQW